MLNNPTTPAADMNTAAKSLMSLGLKVVPLRPAIRDVARSGKWPLTAHGVKDATNDFATFKRLVGSATDFNIGVAMGSASGVVVIDVDPRNGGGRALMQAANSALARCRGRPRASPVAAGALLFSAAPWR